MIAYVFTGLIVIFSGILFGLFAFQTIEDIPIKHTYNLIAASLAFISAGFIMIYSGFKKTPGRFRL